MHSAIYTHYDGRVQEGVWKYGKFQFGTYTFPNSDKYVGEMRNGMYNGQGTFFDADGSVKEGVWKKGKFEYARKDPKVEKRRAAFELSFTKLKAEFEAERNE